MPTLEIFHQPRPRIRSTQVVNVRIGQFAILICKLLTRLVCRISSTQVNTSLWCLILGRPVLIQANEQVIGFPTSESIPTCSYYSTSSFEPQTGRLSLSPVGAMDHFKYFSMLCVQISNILRELYEFPPVPLMGTCADCLKAILELGLSNTYHRNGFKAL